MSCKLEPAIWPRDTGQRIPCFDRCQLIVALMSIINEVHSKPRLYVSANLFWSMAAMLRDSVAAAAVVVVVVVRTRPRAILLAMITMRKSTHGFPFLSRDKYGAPLGGPSGRRSSAIIWLSLILSHMINNFITSIARSIRQGLSLRFSRNDLIFGY